MAAQTTIIFCATQVDSENTVLNLPFFYHLTNIDVTSCSCQQFFRPLYEDMGQKIAIFYCEYRGDACLN